MLATYYTYHKPYHKALDVSGDLWGVVEGEKGWRRYALRVTEDYRELPVFLSESPHNEADWLSNPL